MKADISIDGQGFYTITPESKRGAKWLRRVQGFDGHVAYSDDMNLTQDIADGAHAVGLRVDVNGRRYLGNNRVAA